VGVSRAEKIHGSSLYPVSCGTMPCSCALRCVVWLYALSFSSTPCRVCRLAVHLVVWSYGCRLAYGCRLVRCVVIWLLGYHLAHVWRFSLSFGHSRFLLGHYCGRWVERWSVGLRNEGKKRTAWASHFLGPPLAPPSPPSTGPHPSREGRGTRCA